MAKAASNPELAQGFTLHLEETEGQIERLDKIVEICGIKLKRNYNLSAPKGVAGRNSDNTMIQRILGWEPNTTLRAGLAKTYAWIESQYRDHKAGKRTVV